MKKMTKFFALALLAGAMVSCSTEDTAPTTANGKVAVQFTGGISVNTRASGLAWADGDRIGIFMTGTNQPLSADAIREGVDNVCYQSNGSIGFSPVSGGKTIFFPIDGDVDFYSYYPQTTVNDYKVALDVTDQRKQEAIDFMYAKTEGCNKATPQVFLKFYHKLSNLVLEVQPGNGLTQEDLKKMTVTVKGQNTKATFNLADGTISGEENPADITMKTTEAGKLYEAILLPTEEESRVIEFDLKNGYDAPFVWTMPVKLEGGKRYHYTVVKLSRSAVDISGNIEPWIKAGDDNEHIAQ
ncbi:fimbrillin family protein [Prevotella stercorea]|uniref:fimbrillin family protein n=1 Tax=Leyella stercorea TaxID=363265 RepID=UPI001F33AEFD|nr:fimbrillin family protein [Leyella stercorea]MCF2644843.1 fimbrillin family protein [Leyella stercorea]